MVREKLLTALTHTLAHIQQLCVCVCNSMYHSHSFDFIASVAIGVFVGVYFRSWNVRIAAFAYTRISSISSTTVRKCFYIHVVELPPLSHNDFFLYCIKMLHSNLFISIARTPWAPGITSSFGFRRQIQQPQDRKILMPEAIQGREFGGVLCAIIMWNLTAIIIIINNLRSTLSALRPLRKEFVFSEKETISSTD